MYICVHTNNVVNLLELNKQDKFAELGKQKIVLYKTEQNLFFERI
jgi:hypothetical protein